MEVTVQEKKTTDLLEEARNMIEQYNYGMADQLIEMALEQLYRNNGTV